jgi:hypothetical protein
MLMRSLTLITCLALATLCCPRAVNAEKGIEFFEKKIRPVLVKYCDKCHSADSKTIKGNLRLDLKEGWQLGGDSGDPAVIPGKPEKSLLIRAVRHDDDVSAMPPNQPRLSKKIIADLTAWVRMGAPDPRKGKVERRNEAADWKTEYRRRLRWWSLQPVTMPGPATFAPSDCVHKSGSAPRDFSRDCTD